MYMSLRAHMALGLLGIDSGMELLGHNNFMFNFWMNCQTVFHGSYTSILPAMYEGSASSASLPTLVISCFIFFYSNRREVASHYGFEFHFCIE